MGDVELPKTYDVIIVGTGMVESILAAAMARIGKTLLHLDSNPYYGQLWATFNFEGLENWYLKYLNAENDKNSENEILNSESNDISSLHQTQNESKIVSGLSFKWHIPSSSEEGTCGQEEARNLPNWTQEKIKDLSRKFNLDLSPKLLFSNGDMVKLLLESNVSRYTEFLSVMNVLTYINNNLQPVPCSKSDVFSSKYVSIIDKRILMKILSICLNDDDSPFQDFHGKTFFQFLKSQHVPEHLIHYIIYAIALGSKEMSCSETVQRAQKFLKSLGRYGNSPFLWPLYGSSELLQAYCRMCAIYGGIYYLNRGAEALVVNERFTCEGVISNNVHLYSDNVIISAALAPDSYCDSTDLKLISRGILITDRPLYCGLKPGISMFQFPTEGKRNPILIIELNSDTYSCPSGLYVVHLTCRHLSSAENDFDEVINTLFIKADLEDIPSSKVNVSMESGTFIEDTIPDKPRILFSCYFSMVDTSSLNVVRKPHNVHICPGPDLEVDFERSINKAKEIFEEMYPGEKFMAPLPDPNTDESIG